MKDGQPDSHGGNDNCIMNHWYYNSMYGWGNHNCESEMPFICEVVAGEVPPTTLEPPTAPPTMPCRVSRISVNTHLLNT